MTDVNAAFAAEKRGQIAQAEQRTADSMLAIARYDSGLAQAELDAKLAQDVKDGKVRMVGADKYEVLTGFDRGEVFRVQRARRPEEIPLILPEHNLDVAEDGSVSLFTAHPAWHDLGWVNDGSTTDVELAIKHGGLDFTVDQRPVMFFDDHGNLHEMPGAFVNARTDRWQGLGVVGDIYKTVQPREAFGWLQDLTGTGELEIVSAGVLRGGAKTFITASLPADVRIDPEGVNVRVKPYLALLDDHSGNRKLWAVLTPWVVVCGNTHNFALRDAVTRWGVRHSTNIHTRLEEARRTLGLTVKGYEAFTAEEEQLLRTKITPGKFDKMIASIWEPTDEGASKNAKTRESNRNAALHEGFAFEAKRLGRNYFAAEMALTGYWDNVVRKATDGKSATARATALLEGEDDKKNAVHKQLLVMAGTK